MDLNEKRKKMTQLTYDTFKALDPTGTNAKHYKEFLESMTDAQFTKFFNTFFAEEDSYFILHVSDYERDLHLDDVEKAAKVLGIPLFEKVASPHITMDLKNVVVTREEVPVGYLNLKRTQQTVYKKNGLSTSMSKRSAITNQVVDNDKNGRNSDMETYMLASIGSKYLLKEFLGPRADDNVMKNEMYGNIARDGFASLGDLTDEPSNKTTLNTIDVYMTAMSLRTDLVTKGNILKKTIRED